MGKQYNKVQKRTRRKRYVARVRAKQRAAALARKRRSS
jgi:hypothetical protein